MSLARPSARLIMMFATLALARSSTKATALCINMIVFFPSRRRHTRCLSDWNSDVCSSDLSHLAEMDERIIGREKGNWNGACGLEGHSTRQWDDRERGRDHVTGESVRRKRDDPIAPLDRKSVV